MTTPLTQDAGQTARTQNKTTIVILAILLACVLLACAAAFFGIRWFQDHYGKFLNGGFLLHGVEVVLQAETADGAVPSEQEMQQVVKILNERTKDSFGSGTFIISGSGQITGRLPKREMFDPKLAALIQVGQIEFVDTGDFSFAEGDYILTDLASNAPAPEFPTRTNIFHTVLTNANVTSAGVTTNSTGNYIVTLEFDDAGRQIFKDFTGTHIGKYLVIAADKCVLSSPKINTEIPEGSAIIEGNFTQETAKDLATFLRYQALPFSLKVISEKEF